MRPSQSIWSRSLNRFFGTTQSKAARQKAVRGNFARRCRFERFEDRLVLSATFSSALSVGGPEGDGIFDIAADASGNSYVTGYFAGTVDFDVNSAHADDADILTSRGSTDAFVAKYASDDSLVWVRRMGGDYVNPGGIVDTGRSITVDAAGNAYVLGEFLATSDFGATTLVASPSANGFVTKISANGSFAWTQNLGSTALGGAEGVGVDAQGNVYALSRPDTKSYNIAKFSATGQSTWTKSITTLNSANGDLTVSANGNVFVVGNFWQTVDFDPSTKVKNISVGQRNAAFALKLDTDGKFGWVTPFYGTGQAYAYTANVDGSGNVIVGGSYNGTVDFNPTNATTTLDTTPGGYIAKLNSSGGLVWAKALTGGSVNAIDTDAAGNVYATGSFGASIDLDPGTAVRARATAGDSDIFVVKLTSAGNYASGETLGGTGLDIGWGIAVDGTGVLHVAGYFADAVDFDPDPLAIQILGAAGARRDGFRLRLRQS